MKLIDKYCSEKDKDKPENKDKIVVSNDALVKIDCTIELSDKLESLRIRL